VINVADTLDLFFRAHTVPVTPQKEYRAKRRATQPKDALIFRCATTSDEKKELLFGAYICAERNGAEYVASAHTYSGWFFTLEGRFSDGLREMELAEGLDPVSFMIYETTGTAYYFARQYDRSLQQLQRSAELYSAPAGRLSRAPPHFTAQSKTCGAGSGERENAWCGRGMASIHFAMKFWAK
jgi:hypothetical protein